ncbi:helix-turn-helix domain-containing protein [Streptomyces sp. NPDC004629]|uniref:transcriptional regulator n=1 Tax=Streptomyces sp. NPDC004629 TaxID=3364705 RepID=UPI0036A6CE82
MEERVSGAAEAGETEEFATLLRGLKDRSGLSYGALAKRLHMSTSTLHRYCNGTAVPNEYAPVERLARVCRATPQELVELHRRWILADAARGRRADQAGAARAGTGAGTGGPTGHAPAKSSPQEAGSDQEAGWAEAAAAADAPRTGGTGSAADPAQRVGAARPTQPGSAPSPGSAAPPSPGTAPASGTGSARTAGERGGDGDTGPGEPGEPVVVGVTGEPARARRRRTALIACAAVAAVLGAVAIVVLPLSGGDGDDPRDEHVAGATAVSGTADAGSPTPAPSPSGRSRTPSASASATATGSGAPSGSGKQGGAVEPTDGTGAVPLTVGTRPYVYEDPCSQHFLVDSEPEQVGPPANEQDAPRWAAAYGAVSSDAQRIALTVQGTGADTVVLEALHVRVVAKGAPLAWNDYSMGVGCGGGVGTKSFDIDLDNGSPTVTVKNGQRDFPYKVSESDPEVFYVTARTEAHDVRWDLTLDWSSGSRRGTIHIDNGGTPFRTSADVGRPGYDYPLGGSDWIERVG